MAPKPPQLGKILSEEGLAKDLQYVLHGIDVHHVLASICPPQYGIRMLEAGCGSGKLGVWFALRGAAVFLLDIDPQAIEYAKNLWLLARAATPVTGSYSDPHFQVGSVLALPFPDASVDFCFNEGVPQHWGFNSHDTRRQRCLNEMVRVTKPGGHVCIIGTNGHCPAAVEMANTTDHTYKGMPPRQKPWTREELTQRLILAGLDRNTVKDWPVEITSNPFTGAPGYLESAWERAHLLAGWGQKP